MTTTPRGTIAQRIRYAVHILLDRPIAYRVQIRGGILGGGQQHLVIANCVFGPADANTPAIDRKHAWPCRELTPLIDEPSRDVLGEPPAREGAAGVRPRDPEAENAVAEVVMGYGHDGWLPLHLRYGIADEVLDRLRALGYQRASSSAVRTVTERALEEAVGRQIVVGATDQHLTRADVDRVAQALNPLPWSDAYRVTWAEGDTRGRDELVEQHRERARVQARLAIAALGLTIEADA